MSALNTDGGTSLTPQQVAEAVRVGMYAVDRATQSLGITIDAIAAQGYLAGPVELTLRVVRKL